MSQSHSSQQGQRFAAAAATIKSGFTGSRALETTDAKEKQNVRTLQEKTRTAMNDYQTAQSMLLSNPPETTFADAKQILDARRNDMLREVATSALGGINYMEMRNNLRTQQEHGLSMQKENVAKLLQKNDEKQSVIRHLTAQRDTLNGALEDNRLQMTAAYMRYFVWFVAASTMGLVGIKMLAK